MSKHKYLPADKFIIYHEDDHGLVPIRVPLPEPPPVEKIQGHGLLPENQYWKIETMPARLKVLHSRKVPDSEKRAEIAGNEIYYKNEIKWMQGEWDKIENGLWIYIKGKPHFIPGIFYFYLTYWTVDDINPLYFKRDWMYWIFSEWSDADPLCSGINYIKFRREGATTKVSCWRYYRAMMNRNHNAGCQSKNRDHASKIHKDFILKPWKKLPWFVRPVWDGDYQNTTSLNFTSPSAQKDPDSKKDGLDSVIDFKDASLYAYDGTKQHSVHNDECGKLEDVKFSERYQIQKPTTEDGSEAIGKFRNTSTVGKMDMQGGRDFKLVANDSHYEKRTENKRTKSGLFNLFITATEGFRMKKSDVAMILKQLGRDPATAVSLPDKYGDSDPEIVYRFLKNKRQAFLDDGDIAGYIEECREFPITWSDCWKESSKSQNFNMLKLENRLSILDDERVYSAEVVCGNFKWEGDDPKSARVYFEKSDAGNFYVSYLFEKDTESNRYFMRDGIRYPANVNRFQAGGDPYKFKITKGGKRSNGAGAVFMRQNSAIDSDAKDVSQWITHRFCCTYSHRPKDKYTYADDMLKMCVYYGCEMNSEINVDLLWTYFEDKGYFGYLTHGTDRKTGKLNKTPGGSTTGKTFDEICVEYHTYIENHCERELHRELLYECKMIDNDMGDYDLFTAGGYALLAIKSNSFRQHEDKLNLVEKYFDEYSYDSNGSHLVEEDEY